MKKIVVPFWGFTDNSNKRLIYSYIFSYIIIILTWRKIYLHLYRIGKKNLLWKIQHFHLSHSFIRDQPSDDSVKTRFAKCGQPQEVLGRWESCAHRVPMSSEAYIRVSVCVCAARTRMYKLVTVMPVPRSKLISMASKCVPYSLRRNFSSVRGQPEINRWFCYSAMQCRASQSLLIHN